MLSRFGFANLSSVKEDATSVSMQGELRTRVPPREESLLFNLLLQPQAQPCVQVAVATKACEQQPTCTTGNLNRVGEGTSKHSSAQALMAVGRPPESWLEGTQWLGEREGSIQHIQTCP